jgi:hypothetical protein
LEYVFPEIPCEAKAALYIALRSRILLSSVADVKEIQTGQVDAQWIVFIEVNYHVLCTKLYMQKIGLLETTTPFYMAQFRLDLIYF